MQGTLRWLSHSSKRLIVSIDWVDVRSFHVLMLAAWQKGRAIPLLWQVARWEDLHHSQNTLEYGLLGLLRTYLPEPVEILLLADRGFGRTEMAKVCQTLKIHYLIRIQCTVHVRHDRFTGRLEKFPVRSGRQAFFRQAVYRQKQSLVQNVVIYWHPKKPEPWFLMTDLATLPVKDLTRFYRKRMTIEEYFRDLKSRRTGWGMRLMLIRDPDRLARLLLLLALGYLLLTAVGLFVRRRVPPRAYASNNRPTECSGFFVGRWFLRHTGWPPLQSVLIQLRKELSREYKRKMGMSQQPTCLTEFVNALSACSLCPEDFPPLCLTPSPS